MTKIQRELLELNKKIVTVKSKKQNKKNSSTEEKANFRKQAKIH